MRDLSNALAIAVPLEIERLRLRGGPVAADYAAVGEIAARLGSDGEALLFGDDKRPGEAAAQFVDLVRGLALLAFASGGVRLFGEHWQA